MATKRNLRQIQLQSGCTDRMGRPIVNSMKERAFICWALRDGDALFYQGFGYPTLYATEEDAERDIRNPHLNAVQVEVIVREAL